MGRIRLYGRSEFKMSREVFKKDLFRYYGGKISIKQRLLRDPEISYLYYFRMRSSARNTISKLYYRLMLRRISLKTLIQIPYNTQIGEGFLIAHTGRIIINPESVLGKNINIATGVVIGQENRGKRVGCPNIGNNVWIGANSVIVGNITIGDDVLIAPLSYINFDVPSHAIVVGNPAKTIFRENATESYINRTV